MKLAVKYPAFLDKTSVYLSSLIRIVLYLLLLLAIAAMMLSVYKTGIWLWQNINQSPDAILRQMLLNTVFVLALLEIAITILAYLKVGKVHVRYIVDTVLIIMLNEVVTTWFTHPDTQKAIGLSIIIATLAAVRVSVTRWSPKED